MATIKLIQQDMAKEENVFVSMYRYADHDINYVEYTVVIGSADAIGDNSNLETFDNYESARELFDKHSIGY